MKKVLIEENAERAEALLSKIESVYLARVIKLVGRIRALGIEDITKDMLLEAIERKFQPLQEQYEALYRSDVKVFQTPDMRNQVENAFAAKFREVEKAVDDFYSPEVSNSLPFGLKVLAGVFELDEKHKPYIPAERSEIIREGFREFIESPELLRIYNLHNEVAKKTQELVNLVRSSGLASQNHLLQFGFRAIQDLLLVNDSLEPWLISVKPSHIKYKIEPEEVDE